MSAAAPPEAALDGVPDPASPDAAARGRRRFALEVRLQMDWRREALVLAIALAAGVAISAAILIAQGVAARDLWSEFVVQTFFDRQNLEAVLFQAAPMIMIGLAASLAFRVRYWNLGLEGQMICGAIGATAVSMFQIGPEATRLALMMLCAALAGLAWMIAPVLMKLRLGVNEIISTLMLNYVAANVLLHMVYGPWKDPRDAFPHSPQFAAFERLPDLAPGINSAIPLAVVIAVAVWWLTDVSRAGLYMRFVHANRRAAEAAGIAVHRTVMAAALVSAALAGVAGFIISAGQEGRLTQAFYQGYGFSGILIAFLARNNPLAATVVAVLVAGLFVTGRTLQVFYQVPFAMVQLIQAIIVICVAAADFFIRHRIRRVAPGVA